MKIGSNPAYPDIGSRHAGACCLFDDIPDIFTSFHVVEENSKSPALHSHGCQTCEVVRDTRELTHYDSNVLRPLRSFDAQHLLYCHHITKVID